MSLARVAAFLITLTALHAVLASGVGPSPSAAVSAAPAAIVPSAMAPVPAQAGAPAAVTALTPSAPAAPNAPAPAPTPAATPAAVPEFFNDLDAIGPESWSKIRDPFARPVTKETTVQRTDLERYPVDQYELVGVMSGPTRMRAMVRSPDAKTFLVAENMKMGLRGGFVRKITSAALVVREKVQNILGQEEDVDTVLKLRPKAGEP